MELILDGFLAVLHPMTLFLILAGVILGIIFGAIPGMSATMAVALCLPISFGLSPVEGISLLLGLYIGGISGGLISAILLKIPGTPSSIATTFDGSPLAAKGEAGKALGVGIVYSFLGGLLSFIALIFIAPPIADFSLKFGPTEYFAVTVFSLTMIAALSDGNMFKGLISGLLGLSLSLVGAAPIDNFKRFTFGMYQLDLGFDILPVLIGFYAITEVFQTAGETYILKNGDAVDFKIKGFGFSAKEFFSQIPNLIRSSLIGIGIGILPGIGGGTSNLLAYTAAKSSSKYPEKFGTGIIDGIVASESSNNASIGGALIPLLTLGIPGDTVTAMLLGGLMIHGIQPGPMLFATNGSIVYSIFAALIIGNFLMLAAEFLFMRGFVRLLFIPKNILLSIIVALCAVGAFASNNRYFDIVAMLMFGFLGYLFHLLKFPLPPFILGFILCSTLETNLRRGLQLSNGSLLPFITRPISAVFLSIAALSVLFTIVKTLKKSRAK